MLKYLPPPEHAEPTRTHCQNAHYTHRPQTLAQRTGTQSKPQSQPRTHIFTKLLELVFQEVVAALHFLQPLIQVHLVVLRGALAHKLVLSRNKWPLLAATGDPKEYLTNVHQSGQPALIDMPKESG
jgi:hypothetical protein